MLKNILTVFLFIFGCVALSAQIITTDPAAPQADAPLTITYDASLGTAGLVDCGCDVYLHTGVITPASTTPSDWKYVKTTWGVANAAWKLTPLAGEPNKYTYTFSPSIREYFGVPEGVEIERLAMVFRDAAGNREGKGTGGTDIFIDVNNGSALAVNLLGDPGTASYPLGKALPVTIGTTTEATIELYDNETLVTTVTGTQLDYDLVFTTPGTHTVRVVAKTDGEEVSEEFSIDAELVVERTSPATPVITANAGETFTLAGTSYVVSDLTIMNGSTEIASATASEISQVITVPNAPVTTFTIVSNYQEERATTTVTFISGSPEVAEVPDGLRPGANLSDEGDLTLLLRAPGKSDVFVVGNFNDWSPVASTRMKRSPDDSTFWLQIPKAELPGDDLLYQYVIDQDRRHPDPYSTLVLDPQNDPFISEETFAGIPDYPAEETEGIVSWLRLDSPDFNWQNDDFAQPDPKKMVVYELLIRDFLADHSYTSLTDTLDYLERLGVNTIELLPVSEFEGNISWGYNVSFHMALDKYYGSPEDLKAFVDAAHARDMAVVLDVVYNHAFGQSPLVRMWSDASGFQPSADNPYVNQVARHPFNVGYDFNHESALTKEYVKTTLAYWLEEFHVDGFRFDLSKGFTQNNTGSDVGAWNRYDASRIAIIKDYADLVWSVDEDAYAIMEHLGESREEEELAQYGNGMYFWSGFNPHGAYQEGSMGYPQNSDLRPALAQNRGFSDRNLVTYIESHDEERTVYRNLSFGNRNGDYSVRELPVALDRAELANAFFYTLPGPKMLWQFGELGYDYPINYCQDGRVDDGCRTDPKPIVWEYRDDPDRQDLYHQVADLLFLRNNYDFFHDEITDSRLTGGVKYLHFDSDDGKAVVFGNFTVGTSTLSEAFPSTGTWYDYFSGESVNVTNTSTPVSLAPGEYHLYLSQPVQRGGGRLTSANDIAVALLEFTVSPNPTDGELRASFTLPRAAQVEVSLLDVMGRQVRRLQQANLPSGAHTLTSDIGELPAGLYFLRITDGNSSAVRQLIIR